MFSLKNTKDFCNLLSNNFIQILKTLYADLYRKLSLILFSLCIFICFRYVKSLVLLMVDLLDFPCSIWPGIVDVIDKDRPIFIVANKVC